MSSEADDNKRPTNAEARDELDRILSSGIFKTAPKLASFLRFIVTSTLNGEGDRLKGYTIGVEALGRPADFDPQVDAIVRVEAGRLRSALGRYYAGPGRNDPVVIDLPRGVCVPTFRVRSLPLGLRKYPFSARRIVFHTALRRWRLAARVAVFIAGLSIAINAAAVAVLWWQATLIPRVAASVSEAAVMPVPAAFPVLSVDAVAVAGLSRDDDNAVIKLRGTLRDALAQFDEIELASDWKGERSDTSGGPLSMRRITYRLTASAEADADSGLKLSLRLHDNRDGVVVWSRVFEKLQVVNATIVNEKELVQRIAPTLAQPFGVIYSRELNKGPAGAGGLGYRCSLEVFEFLRWRTPDRHRRVRECIGDVMASMPASAGAFIALSYQQLHDHYDRSGTDDALDRALRAAQRAVSLDPASARAYHVLMNALYARGDIVAAFEAGKKAIANNPWDTFVQISYATRLLRSGDRERAMTLLRRADEFSPGQPQFLSFALFLGAYMGGDDAAAARYAQRLTSDDNANIVAARAIVALRGGYFDRARREIQKLRQLRPGWRQNARLEFERHGAPANVADRLASDLSVAVARFSN